jgi:GT2 family glycosyltransferase
MPDPNPTLEPLVYVLMLSWNDEQDVLDCLHSVYQLDYERYNVLVVDNASSAGTVQAIRAAYPQVELIVNEANLGFGGGANVGFERALARGADYVLFINGDTVVDPGLLKELVAAARAHPRAGMLIPRIYFYAGPSSDEPPRVWSVGARWAPFPPRVKMIGWGKPDHPRYDVPRQLDFATGCAQLVRRQVLESVGGFDPIYWPAYQEDYDYSARVTQAGWEIWYVPEARMWHKETRSRRQSGARAKAFNLGKNTVPFYVRHTRPPLLSLFSYVVWVVVREMVKLNWSFVAPFLGGVRTGWAHHRGETRR